MANKTTPQKKVKVEVRPASNILKVILILLILTSIVALIALRWVHTGILTEIADLKEEASGLEYANEELEKNIPILSRWRWRWIRVWWWALRAADIFRPTAAVIFPRLQ